MRVYETDKIRNVALIGNKGVGKTSIVDALLFATGANSRIGKVADGTSMVEVDATEIKRRQTLGARVVPLEWKGFKINVLDTPGYIDFAGDALSSLWVSDVAALVVDAVGGVDIQAKHLFAQAKEWNKPVVFVINKCDSDRADIKKVVGQLCEQLTPKTVLMQVPIGLKNTFKGVVDILNMKAYVSEGGKAKETTPPADTADEAGKGRVAILDAVAENDEALLEKYLGGAELSAEEAKKGMVVGCTAGTISPVVLTSGAAGVGTEAFLDMVIQSCPSPKDLPAVKGKGDSDAQETRKVDDPFSALVFKATSDPGIGDIFFFRVWSGSVGHGDDVYDATKRNTERMSHLFVMRGRDRVELERVFAGDIACVAKLKTVAIGDSLAIKSKPIVFDPIKLPEPMVSLSVRPKTKADQDKLGSGLAKMASLDPTFKMNVDHEFNEMIISGMGEIHLEVVLERLKDRYGIEIEVGKPRIPYRETVQKTVKMQGKHKKQSGGRGQYGDCWIELSPLALGTGFQFENDIFGGSIPSKYVPAVEKGVREAMSKGGLAGYPVVDVKVTLNDGSYHEVDSSDLAFQIAGSLAFKAAEEQASPILLEPIMNVEVTAPKDFVGDVSSDIASKRGRVSGIDSVGDVSVVKASIPLAELYKYSTTLRSMTSGAASHTMSFSHYEVVPSHIAQKVIDEAKRMKEEKK